MKHYKENTLESISCDLCKKSGAPNEPIVSNMLNIEHTFGHGTKYDGETWVADICEQCVIEHFMSFMNQKTQKQFTIERNESFSIVNLKNPKNTVFKIYRDLALQTDEKFAQDGNKFFIQGKTFVVLEHSEQLQYVIDNLDFTVKKILDFFPLRFIGRVAEMKDELIKGNLPNLKNILSNQVIYKIVSEAISIKGFPAFISSFPPEPDRKNWITISDKSYVVYRIK